VPIDFAERGGAARFRQHDHAVDALDVVDAHRERAGRDRIHGQARAGEQLVDPLDDAALAPDPLNRKLARRRKA
jgi:hypothetical protein